MESERFVLIDDYDGGCAIRDSSKPEGYDILASLPVHAWAMAPLVDELNKLQAVVEAARLFVTEQRRVHDVNERIRKGQAYEASELPYDELDKLWGQLQREVDALATE